MKEKFEQILENYKKNEGSLISVLQDVQNAFGYIPEEAVAWFAEKLDVPASKFYGIATFYSQFHLKPRGRHIVTACCGTACHVNGSDKIIAGLRRELGLAPGEDTTDDGEITLEEVACIGACSLAPIILVDGEVHAKAKVDKIVKEIQTLEKPE